MFVDILTLLGVGGLALLLVGGGALLVLLTAVPGGLLHPLQGAGGLRWGAVTRGRLLGRRMVWAGTGGAQGSGHKQRLADVNVRCHFNSVEDIRSNSNNNKEEDCEL